MLGCDEHTPGSKEGSDNRREEHGARLHLHLCRVRARHPRVRRQLVCTRDREGKFPMRWSSGAARDQPWLVRSLPVDCRATDGTLRWGGHYEMLPVERPRKHAAMRWTLQIFSRRGRHCRCLTCSPNTGGGEQVQTWCDCECKKKRSTISGIAANHVA